MGRETKFLGHETYGNNDNETMTSETIIMHSWKKLIQKIKV